MTASSSAILVCTLGASWAVIPEVVGWLSPEIVDLYASGSRSDELAATRARFRLRPPNEVWVCTTEGQRARDSLGQVQDWWAGLGRPFVLRIWTATGSDQLASSNECEHMRELIFRAVLAASETVGVDGQVLLSLAGGRKTMSADLQEAGKWFGAGALVHVVGPDRLPEDLLKSDPKLFLRPLTRELADAVTPLVVGTAARSELVDLPLQGDTVRAARFSIPLPPDGGVVSWALPAEGAALVAELAERQRASQSLLGNFMAQLAASEPHENWRSLYRLPARAIEALRADRLTATDRNWLVALPKADLHRHLGGCLDLASQRTVAEAIWSAARPADRDLAMRQVRDLLAQHTPWAWQWPDELKLLESTQRALASSALLLHAGDDRLRFNLYTITAPRLALKWRSPYGFAAYERPGELSGSALLGDPASIAAYARAIVLQAREEGLAYLELRGSPDKYRPHDPAGFLADLETELARAGAQTRAFDAANAAPRIGFLWILDRRRRDAIRATVAAAVGARGRLQGFLLGLDLAGDEGTAAPEDLAADFEPAFADCLPLTIHAGEGETAQHIWQAAYHLHADRIGHGLTLADHPQLAQRFRDRRIALELCPTSNLQVVGFADPHVEASRDLAQYPLRGLIDAGLPLCLCTDNPGISATTLADEFLAAARMDSSGLSRWEALALVRQAFVHAFIPAAERDQLLKHADHRIHQQISTEDSH